MDFAGGLGEEESKDKEDSDDNDGDSDGEAPDMDTLGNSDDDEPTGLDGEDDENFKDLSSGDEDEQMDQMLGDDDDLDEEGFGGDELDEEGFGADDFDEEGFGEDDELEDTTSSKIKIKPKKGKPKYPKFDPNNLSSLFADAEEFAHLLDENDDEGMGTSVANKDKASKKTVELGRQKRESNEGPQSWKNKKKGRKPGI